MPAIKPKNIKTDPAAFVSTDRSAGIVYDALAALKTATTKNLTKIKDNAKKKAMMSSEIVSLIEDVNSIHKQFLGTKLRIREATVEKKKKAPPSAKLPPGVILAIGKLHKAFALFKKHLNTAKAQGHIRYRDGREHISSLIIGFVNDLLALHKHAVGKKYPLNENHKEFIGTLVREHREMSEVETTVTDATASLSINEDLSVEQREDERITPQGGSGSLPRKEARKHVVGKLKVLAALAADEEREDAFALEFANLVNWVDAMYHDVSSYRNARARYKAALKRN